MADRAPDDLRERNRVLDAQVKLLIKSEQRLHLSQRSLFHELRRVDAANRFALGASATDDPAAIAELAFEMIFSVFPFEQGLAIMVARDRTVPLAIGAVTGREHEGPRGLARLRERAPRVVDLPEAPVIVTAPGEAPPVVRDLLALIDEVFTSPADEVARGAALVLPLTSPGRRGALILRRLGRATSFHEPLPTARDLPGLTLVARQVAAALAKAELVASLRQSVGELETAQRELVRRERLAAIGELAAVVAHEVRNPLGAIFNSVAALDHFGARTSDERLCLDVLREEAARLNRIVGDLIDFSRPAPTSKDEVALAPIVASALESAAREAEARRVALEHHVEADLSAVVDEDLLRRALLNLVDNATHATSEGGVVRVRVARGVDEVVIEVSDDGHGIPGDAMAQIFEPFFTTKATGTGLGLAVVRRFVDAHAGTVEVRSDVGKGSVFTIRLGL